MTYNGRSPISGEPVTVHVEDGRILATAPAPPSTGDIWIAPGFIDLQVNGFAGVDYNSLDTSLEEIARSIDLMRACGVTRFLPTVITGSPETMCGSLRNLAKAKRELPQGESMAGFHVEGPWISPAEGPRGAHPIQHVRAATIEEWKLLQDAAEGQIRLLTIAPEQEGALAMIEHVSSGGVVVSIGHTGASVEQIQAAIASGATMSTHLGNAAEKLLPRANCVLEQMAADELCASFIVDGIHLPLSFLRVALRAKGLEKAILVTDAVAPAGREPGRYRLGDLEVELTADGSVRLPGTQRLAGSALSMDRAIGNIMSMLGLSLEQALRLATVNPARCLGIEGRQGFLEAGERADLVLFRFDPESKQIQVQQTTVGGCA